MTRSLQHKAHVLHCGSKPFARCHADYDRTDSRLILPDNSDVLRQSQNWNGMNGKYQVPTFGVTGNCRTGAVYDIYCIALWHMADVLPCISEISLYDS
jgi:hypothetical protein